MKVVKNFIEKNVDKLAALTALFIAFVLMAIIFIFFDMVMASDFINKLNSLFLEYYPFSALALLFILLFIFGFALRYFFNVAKKIDEAEESKKQS